MNPNNREGGSAPGFENQPFPEAGEGEEAQEAAPAAPEKDTSAVKAPPIALPQDMPDAPAPTLPSDDMADDDSAQTLPSLPTSEGHVDLRPWVDKTKEVIASTKDDPFTQKREISKVKAEFIKNRFNKVIKAEDSA